MSQQIKRLSKTQQQQLAALMVRCSYRRLARDWGIHHSTLAAAALGCEVRHSSRFTIAAKLAETLAKLNADADAPAATMGDAA